MHASHVVSIDYTMCLGFIKFNYYRALFLDSFHESRPNSQQLCDALPSDDSIESTQPSDKQHHNQTKLLATLDEYHQPVDGQNHTVVHSRMQLDCTVKQTAV